MTATKQRCEKGRPYQKGLCYQALGALHEAYNTYNAVLVMNPTHVLALRATGLLFQSHGLLTEAAEGFKRALAVQPHDAATKERLAATLTDLGTRVKLISGRGHCVVPGSFLGGQHLCSRFLQPRRGAI